jgi:hypothetical protein
MDVYNTPYASTANAPRSLGRMIRDEEMRRTMRILNTGVQQRRVVSYAERYRNADTGAKRVRTLPLPAVRNRLASMLGH